MTAVTACREEHDGGADQAAQQVRSGSSAITVHPRTMYEIASARKILHRNRPVAMEEILH